jgi:hypothetical protein
MAGARLLTHYSPVCPLAVTVRADYVALLNLLFDGTHRHVINLIHLEHLLLTFEVVKVHYIIRILYAAVSTRTRFNLVQIFAPPGV